jgi:uncharacterized membrane protein
VSFAGFVGIASDMSVKAAITIRRPQAELEAAWREHGGDLAETAEVRFEPAPGDQGTELHVEVEQTGLDKLKGLFGDDPMTDVKDELRRLKQIVETGEIVRSDGSPDGQSIGRLMRQKPAQPVEAS